ncbi:MAG: rhodanese-like domain-containing protein [Hyphomicrobium sp.]|nr:rhodanese-like domain-containing protein [Hyphomicrobium sp.]
MRSRPGGLWLALALAVVAFPASGRADTPAGPEFDPASGYRIARYRAPLPETVPGATRIFAADVPALVKDKRARLIDVMAAEGAGYDAKTGRWRLAKTHDHIPGSIWLPDVGKGVVDARLDAYFQLSLEQATDGDKTRSLIIYCQSDCWMSWNAVKRAASYGYTSIYWLPEGIDGWRDWDWPLVPANPEPVPPIP